MLLSNSSDEEEEAKAMDPNQSQDPSQCKSEDEDSLEEDCTPDYRAMFAAHITAKAMFIPHKVFNDFQVECFALCREYQKHPLEK